MKVKVKVLIPFPHLPGACRIPLVQEQNLTNSITTSEPFQNKNSMTYSKTNESIKKPAFVERLRT